MKKQDNSGYNFNTNMRTNILYIFPDFPQEHVGT